MRIIIFVLIVCINVLAIAQIPVKVVKLDSLVIASEKKWEACCNSGIYKVDDFAKCNTSILQLYEDISKLYLNILIKYLTVDDAKILSKAICYMDSTYVLSKKINSHIFGTNTSYHLGYESLISGDLILKENREYKYKLLRSYILSISERSEDSLDFDISDK